MTENTALLDINGLKTYFHTGRGLVKAVEDLNITIEKGKTLGLVGESGSGKSVTSLSIMKLLPDTAAKIDAGSISFLGKDLVKLSDPEMRNIRGRDISMIFQEPGTSLNPVFRVGKQVMETIMLHQQVTAAEAKQRTIELFHEVGILDPERRFSSYPHEMSGGQKQRVMIAMALSCNPELLIADEPTTALDVTIQAQILNLLRKLRDERGMSILFITHDLSVIAEIADDVAVMFRGKLVEYKPVVEIFENPEHPYTKGLLACRPALDTTFKRLPTVSDFMDFEETELGEYIIEEKEFDKSQFNDLTSHGRKRLLHPLSELETIGYQADDVKALPESQLVKEGEAPILSLDQLQVYYPIKSGILRRTVDHVKAVDGISLNIYRGQTLGLVGESGCGKTTTGKAIVGLAPVTDGKILFEGNDLAHMSRAGRKPFRRKVQIIFQDPYSSLNPRMMVSTIITESMIAHNLGTSKQDRRDRAASLLEEVGLPVEYLDRYPHEFSGGQRQRISIARALAVEPEFIICDESVSALDVSVQAQVLNLLKDLQEQYNLTYIFISHDLSVVKFMSDMMAVMNQGKLVELGPSEMIYQNPQEGYTRKLIESIPTDDLLQIKKRVNDREKQAFEA
ncbi:ABC transporter ATP-binding protein [Gimesia fumaroli]|uniref:Glutathione import ATP-binding protein GsiA n=1 Tax=Gimesia fumaroli TaxID=2527976 RepID=A0A518IDA1_9PLAN|nr:dipeptide ABC transporter ATP-binding protein [Gimesia fumaroli]QDV51081.1 Glutathione import ATP-binding protein GsiA [Gimesia fumaroli]